jgi:hypothetical protein
MYLMDVNVLVYAHRTDAANHSADTDEWAIIRASLSSGTPLGNSCFKKKIEIMTGRKVGLILLGRPRK